MNVNYSACRDTASAAVMV